MINAPTWVIFKIHSKLICRKLAAASTGWLNSIKIYNYMRYFVTEVNGETSVLEVYSSTFTFTL